MKKFRIKDEDGMEYSVEEVAEEKKDVEDDEVMGSALSEEEIAGLKKLAPMADKLLALLEVEEKEHDVDESLEEEMSDADEDEEICPECHKNPCECNEKEEIVDTDEEEESDKIKDSVGSIETKCKSNDSIDVQDEIASAWAKRLNGGNK